MDSLTGDASLLKEQAAVLEMIVRDQPLPAVLAALCAIVERHAEQPVRAAILLADEGATCLRTGAAPSLPDAYNRAVDGVPIKADLGTCAAAAARREVVVTPDIANDPNWAPLRDLPLGLGLRAAWSMPILSSTQSVLGTFGTYFTECREPSASERRLVEVVARTAALAIERSQEVAARAAASRALAESRSRLDYAVRLSGVGFWYCDLPFSELIWDARVREHFFCEPDERISLEHFYERLHPADRASTREAIESSIRDGAPYDVVYRTVDPRSGACKWIRALGGTTYHDDESPARFDGVTVDITAQKRDEELLRAQDRRKDEFLATLAHELRNPLAPIRTGLELLDRSAPDDPAAVRARATMQRQLRHMIHLVDDLLDVSRIRCGKIELRRERLTANSVLEHAIEASRPMIDAAGQRLAVHVPQATIWLDGDLTRLAQAIGNLLNNAAKYSPPGSVIETSVAAEGGEVLFRVADRGAGIPESMLDKVFDLFARVDRPLERTQGGLGIGLAVVKMLVDLHGGRIEVRSEGSERGSTFTIRLPISESAAEASAPARAEESGATVAARRILLVDDNADAAEMLSMMLELEGHQTRIVNDGESALPTAEAFQPELVLLDIGLPDIDGWEVARRLRASHGEGAPRLVAVTGYGSREDQQRASDAGFHAHLTKPVDIASILAIVADL